MSDYQKQKALAAAMQAKREAQLEREIAKKQEAVSAAAKEAELKRKRLEDAAKEARRKELMAAHNAQQDSAARLAASSIEYNPFAEDEKRPNRPDPFASLSKPKKTNTNGETSKITTNNPSSSRKRDIDSPRRNVVNGKRVQSNAGAHNKSKDKRSESPPLLGRKERAAKAFAQSVKKQAKAESIFSVRDLVDSAPRNSKNGSHSPLPPYSSQPHQPTSRIALAPTAKSTISGLKGKGKSVNGGIGELRKLAPNREGWDRRTIDEIQKDLRAAKGKDLKNEGGEDMRRTASSDMQARINGGLSIKKDKKNGEDMRRTISSDAPFRNNGTSSVKKDKDKLRSNQSASPLPASKPPKPKLPPISSSAKSHPPSNFRPGHPYPSSAKRRQSSSSGSDADNASEGYSSSSSSNDPRLRKRSPVLHEKDVSSVIQSMFRRPGSGPAKRRWDDDLSDASSDMEAGLSDVELEEKRTARIARKEDELAEKEERARREAKERLKKARMGKS